ncbi:MAG: hypothetical protein RLZZ383_2102, partial [Pseudomonadota bacterium]
MRVRVVGIGAWWGLVACGTPSAVPGDEQGDPSDTGQAPDARVVTWHDDVRPIFEAQCVACHEVGGAAPLPFAERDAAWSQPPAWAIASAAAVEAGTMPPWKADPGCAPIRGARVLGEAERATVAAWAQAGLPSGTPRPYEAPVVTHDQGLPSYTLRMPERFVPDASSPDDYRCFVLDFNNPTEVWMSGFEVYAEHPEMVH